MGGRGRKHKKGQTRSIHLIHGKDLASSYKTAINYMKLSKIAAFITKQRLFIIVGSLSIAIVLIILAASVSMESLIGSLLVNLAASAIAVGAAVTFVDYLLSKEKDVQSREGRAMARLEAKSIQMLIGVAINNLYRRYGPKDSISLPESGEDAYINYLYSHLDETDLKDKGFKFHAKDITYFESEIASAISSIEKTIAMYGYALSPTNRSNLHHLYTQLRAIDSALSSRNHALHGMKNGSKSKLREFTKTFDELLKLHLEQLYNLSKDKFTIGI